MVRKLSYAEAVKLIEGTESKTVKALDGILGGFLLAAAGLGTPLALALFGPKTELVRLSNDVVSGLSDRMRGIGRIDRTERLTAAQRILILTAFFESLRSDSIPEELRGRIVAWHSTETAVGHPLDSHRLPALARALNDSDIPTGAPYDGDGTSRPALTEFYVRLGTDLLFYVQGLPVWDGLDPGERDELTTALTVAVPAAACDGYERLFRKLADDFPEVASWVGQLELAAARAELRSVNMSLEGLGETFERLAADGVPDERRLALFRGYRAALDKPIVETGLMSDGLIIPPLGAAYVDPDFKAAAVAPEDRFDQEGWWERHQVRSDLRRFLVGYLTSVEATERPLILLGQPGSGKSVLTKVIAARLPPAAFLVVRVPLSEVPADTDLQSQIEFAIREATGDSLSWPALVRSARGEALPVLVLDGFDELLQTTGASRTDFLEQVTRFQEREADQGRPMAVIVTSRTAVADRARVPRRGMVAVKLEPFSRAQITRWLKVWKETNEESLARRSLYPLPASAAFEHPELSSQPLLLLMLAMYDTVSNTLQTEGPDLGRAGLYERILVSFVEREIAKSRPGLSPRSLAVEVERELSDLSVAAFSMANRGRHWITEEELNWDFRALSKRGPDSPRGFAAPTTAAQTVVSRFFFVHQARSQRDGQTLTTCEFLHATFGEFLVARLIDRELTYYLAVAGATTVQDRRGVDDAFLRFLCPLLSFVPLSGRGQALEFLGKLVDRLGRGDRDDLRSLLLGLFVGLNDPTRADGPQVPYGPVGFSPPARYAAISANLLLLTVVVGGPVAGRELFPSAVSPVTEWKRCAYLWRTQFTTEDWRGLALNLRLERRWEGRDREISVDLGHWDPPPLDTYWTFGFPPGDIHRSGGGWRYPESRALRRESYLVCDADEDIAWHTLEPFTRGIPMPIIRKDHATSAFGTLSEEHAISTGHALIDLWLTSSGSSTDLELAAAYERCLSVVEGSRSRDQVESHAALHGRVLRIMAADADRLPADLLSRARARFSTTILLPGYLSGRPEIDRWARQAFARLADEPLTDDS